MAGYGILGKVKEVEEVNIYTFYNTLAFQRAVSQKD
jgi:hypothetical protein